MPTRQTTFSQSIHAPIFIGVDNLFFAIIIGLGWLIKSTFSNILRLSFDVFHHVTFSNLLSIVEISRSTNSSSILPDIMNPSTHETPPLQRTATPTVQLEGNPIDVDFDNPNNEETSQRDQILGERNLREGIEQIRMRLDITREGQSILSFFLNILPFLMLFAVKFILDHVYDITLLVLLFSFFIQADYHVQKFFSGGMPRKIIQVVYTTVYMSLVFTYLTVVVVDDFSFTNVFGLNFSYFVNGEYKDLTMTTTIYGIIISDISFKLITVIPKLMIVVCPEEWIIAHQKRRFLQFLEYFSQLYRCALPFCPWIRYFLYSSQGSNIIAFAFSTSYSTLKIAEIIRYSVSVRKNLRYLFSESSVGTVPKSWECANEICTVCHEDITQPIKLECNHIFCKVCIETWLDRNTTCPMCRAVVNKDADNEWKNGGTSRSLRFF